MQVCIRGRALPDFCCIDSMFDFTQFEILIYIIDGVVKPLITRQVLPAAHVWYVFIEEPSSYVKLYLILAR